MNFIDLFLFFEKNFIVPYFSYFYLNNISLHLNERELFTFNKILLLYQNLLISFLELKVKAIDKEIDFLSKNKALDFCYSISYNYFFFDDWANSPADRKLLIRRKRFFQQAIKILKNDIISKGNDLSLKNFNLIARNSGFVIDVFILKNNIYSVVHETFISMNSMSRVSAVLVKYPFRSCLSVNLNMCGDDFSSYLKIIQTVSKALNLHPYEIIWNLKNNLIDLDCDINYNDYLRLLNKKDVKFIKDFIIFLVETYLKDMEKGLNSSSEDYNILKNYYIINDKPWWHIERVGLITKKQAFFRPVMNYFMGYSNELIYIKPLLEHNLRHNNLNYFLMEQDCIKKGVNDLKSFKITLNLEDNTVFVKNKIFMTDHSIIAIFDKITYYNKERDRASCGYFLLKFLFKNNIKICFTCQQDIAFSLENKKKKIENLANVLGVSVEEIENNIVN